MNQTIIGTADQKDGSAGVVGISVSQQMGVFLAEMDADLEERRKDLIRVEALVADKKALCAALPATLPQVPSKLLISSNVYKADAELDFEVQNWDDVLQLLDALPSVPTVRITAGCTTFIPEERYVKKDGHTDVVTPVGELVYRLSTWTSGLQEEYTWWTRLADKLVRVVAKTKKGHAIVAKAKASVKAVNVEGTLLQVTWTYENLPNGELMQRAGGNATNAIPVTVHQPRGTTFREAVEKPMSASFKTSARRCDC